MEIARSQKCRGGDRLGAAHMTMLPSIVGRLRSALAQKPYSR
jgi:hypothetical protein